MNSKPKKTAMEETLKQNQVEIEKLQNQLAQAER
jgi:hypothetical protein